MLIIKDPHADAVPVRYDSLPFGSCFRLVGDVEGSLFFKTDKGGEPITMTDAEYEIYSRSGDTTIIPSAVVLCQPPVPPVLPEPWKFAPVPLPLPSEPSEFLKLYHQRCQESVSQAYELLEANLWAFYDDSLNHVPVKWKRTWRQRVNAWKSRLRDRVQTKLARLFPSWIRNPWEDYH